MKTRGVKKGDRVTIYMPMIPEAAYAMLACARIGAVHSVVFGGFSPTALKAASSIAIASSSSRPMKACAAARKFRLKRMPMRHWQECPYVKTVIVVQRTGGKVAMKAGRDRLVS